eukprot:TCALIF_10836-PA protein Name:"Similar to gbb Protein 60A (Drosophila virilis)" AED:0.23 eAED:0.24 QI:0/0/0/0.33/1/1/3/0/400
MPTLNISLTEYAQLMRVYQKSVEQAELLQELQEDFAEEENSAEDFEVGHDANQVSLTKSIFLTSRHRYTAENLWARRKRNARLATKAKVNHQNQSPETDSMTVFYPLETSDDEEAKDNLIMVESATLHLRLRLKSPMKLQAGQRDEAKVSVRQILDADDERSGIVIHSERFNAKNAFAKNTRGSLRNTIDLSLDVSHAVQQWILRPNENYGLHIECPSCSALGLELVQPKTKTPSLVVDTKQKTMSFRERQKRSYLDMDSVILRKSRRRRVDCRSPATNPLVKSNKRPKRQRCCRQTMKIDFSKLEGFQHILQPAAFDAHVCQGRCPSRFNPANDHALLQSLMHMETRHLGKREQGKVPRPCCAPAKMLPLPILHLSENSQQKLDVSHWKNVIVGECRCS